MIHQNKSLVAYCLLVLAPLFWAGNFVMGRVLHGDIPPFTLAFYRWLLVIIILFPINYPKLIKYKNEIIKHWFSIFILSILSITLYTSFVYLGLHFTTVVSASLINAIVPALIVFLSYFLIKESLTIGKLIGIVLSLLGVAFIITKGDLSAILRLHLNLGDLIIVIAAISWAFFSVLLKRLPKSIPPYLFLLITAIIGDIVLLPCYLMEHYLGFVMHYNWVSISGIIYAAFFSSVLAFTFWNIGVREIGPSRAAYFFNLLPVFGSLLAIIFLGEKIHAYHLLGFFFVFAGIYLATKKKLQPRPLNEAV